MYIKKKTVTTHHIIIVNLGYIDINHIWEDDILQLSYVVHNGTLWMKRTDPLHLYIIMYLMDSL